MASVRGRVVQLLLLGLIVGGFLGAGVFVLLQNYTGDHVTVSVTSCIEQRRSDTCHGTWTVDGRRHEGVVEGASTDDLGSTVAARAHGDRAYVPNWRVPVVFLVLGGMLPLAGFVSVVRRRRLSASPAPGR